MRKKKVYHIFIIFLTTGLLTMIYSFCVTLPPDDSLSKYSDLCRYSQTSRLKANLEVSFLTTPTAGLKLNHYLEKCGVDPVIQFRLFSRCNLKVLSKSHFVKNILFVALNFVFSNYFCIQIMLQITVFKKSNYYILS